MTLNDNEDSRKEIHSTTTSSTSSAVDTSSDSAHNSNRNSLCVQCKCTIDKKDAANEKDSDVHNLDNKQTTSEQGKEREKRDRSPSIDSVKQEKKKICCCHEECHVAKKSSKEQNNYNTRGKTVDTLSADSTGTNENVESTGNGNTNESFKFFIGGIPQLITNKDIAEYFEQYGTVQNVIIAEDHRTKRNRGFAFVTMASQENMDKILKGPHELKGKRVDVREENNTTPSDIKRKIFVGGLNYFWTKDILTTYFSAYGEIDLAQIVLDSCGRSRCFGFVVFANEHSVENVLKSKKHIIHDKVVEVRKAEPKKPKASYKRSRPKNNDKQTRALLPKKFPFNKEAVEQWTNFMYSTYRFPFLFNQRFPYNAPGLYSPYNTNNNYSFAALENLPTQDPPN